MNRSLYHVQKDSVERIADMLSRSSLSLGDRVCVADAENGETIYELTAYPSTLLGNWRIVAGRGYTPSSPGAPPLAVGSPGVASFKSRTGAVAPMAGDYNAAQVSVTPSGGLASRDVQAALLELDSEATALNTKMTALETKGTGVASFKTRAGAVVPQAGDYSADQVSVTPSGGLAASDVQSALVELDSEATALTAKVTTVDGKVTTLAGQVAEVQAKSGVTSFKSRTGAVAPMAGDYSADQVSVTPTGGLAAANVQAALTELDSEATALTAKVTAAEGKITTLEIKGAGVTSFMNRTGAVASMGGDYNAAQVSVTPTGGLAAANVQAALSDLYERKISAFNVSVVPSGTLKATDLQTALRELDQKKASISGENLSTLAALEGDWISFTSALRNYQVKTTVGGLFSGRLLTKPVLCGYSERVENQTVTAPTFSVSSPDTGNVKRLTLSIDAELTLPYLSLTDDTAATLTIIIVQDDTGNRKVTFKDGNSHGILWDCGVSEQALATSPKEETTFSFYKIGSSAWKAVRTHKGG